MDEKNTTVFGRKSSKKVAGFVRDVHWKVTDDVSLCKKCLIMLIKQENGEDVFDFSRTLCSQCLE